MDPPPSWPLMMHVNKVASRWPSTDVALDPLIAPLAQTGGNTAHSVRPIAAGVLGLPQPFSVTSERAPLLLVGQVFVLRLGAEGSGVVGDAVLAAVVLHADGQLAPGELAADGVMPAKFRAMDVIPSGTLPLVGAGGPLLVGCGGQSLGRQAVGERELLAPLLELPALGAVMPSTGTC
jgi:hypothetical protein